MAREFSFKTELTSALPPISLAVAVFIAGMATWGLLITGGVGAVVTALAVMGLGCAWSLRPPYVLLRKRAERRLAAGETPRQRDRRTVWAASKGLAATFVIWNLVSVGMYLSHDSGDPLQQQLAAWGRNHGLGPVIDYLEVNTYDVPPSKEPAQDLSLAVTGETSTSTIPTTTPAGTGTADTGPTTTVDPGPQAPAALTTFFTPALNGEGQWSVIASAGGHPALWATSIRPFPDAGGVVGSIVVIDQTYLRAGMFNGSEEPGGDWVRDDRVPNELYASLVAAMNGGFRFEHVKGGYVTEGRVVKPLLDGQATLAVGKDGKLALGMWGRDLKNDGSWLSIRQNLTLMVDGATSKVAEGLAAGTFWGANYGKDVYVNRSAACEMPDGRLAYMIIGLVSAEQMAQSMINIGCQKAIQLDINGTWPNFFTFEHKADGGVKPIFLDRRMGSNTYRYIKGSTKEFFAFFDSTLVPPASVLDT